MNDELEMTTMVENPLSNYMRKSTFSVKLPSNGGWYKHGMIEFNAIGEVEIRPMVTSDELSLLNPFELVSGNSIVELIKSCCPSIHNPEELYYPDINVLLLGIKRATYGEMIQQSAMCPKCLEKVQKFEYEEYKKILDDKGLDINTISSEEIQKIKNEHSDEIKAKITQMEKDGQINLMAQEFDYSIDELLGQMTFMPREKVVKLDNGLEIYVSPFKCSDKIRIKNQEIQRQKMMNIISKISTDENLSDVEQEEKGKEIKELFVRFNEENAETTASGILKIITPDGTIVENKKFISDFIKDCSSDTYNKINEAISEMNSYGIKQTIDMECECCGHKWESIFYGFNQSDFFGISS